MSALTAHRIPSLAPGSAEWFRYMTASKIAAAIGLSRWESPFSLWHHMAGLVEPDGDNDQTRRGHYLEPAIRAWFADQHPELEVATTGTWVHDVRGWQAASPDALVGRRVDGTTVREIVALAEFKSAHEDDEWGQPGTDEIPVDYRCQAMWQMDTLGIHICHVAVLTRHLQFAEYVVHWNETEAMLLREAGQDFMASIAAGDRPDIDAHGETYRALRKLHPSIEDRDVDLTPELATEYCTARASLRDAEAREQRARSLIAEAMGLARRARYARRTIATRQAKGEGVPYVVAGRNLPDLSTTKAA